MTIKSFRLQTPLLIAANCRTKSAVSRNHLQFSTALLVSDLHRNTTDLVSAEHKNMFWRPLTVAKTSLTPMTVYYKVLCIGIQPKYVKHEQDRPTVTETHTNTDKHRRTHYQPHSNQSIYLSRIE